MLQSRPQSASVQSTQKSRNYLIIQFTFSSGACATECLILYIHTFCTVAREEIKDVPLKCSK
jgi:hypothetical protein